MGGKKKETDDRFKKFGTVSFTSISKINDFIDYLEDGKLMGSGCEKCGQVFFPPRADCHECLSSDMKWFEVKGTGKLATYSRLKYAPAGFQDDAPYMVAVLDYGAYKVFGRIAADLSEDEIEIGMEMVASPNRLEGGQMNYVFAKA
ncbi:DNA-binding protein [Candidatus Desulfarcum epimagneticum]|uniref:DNA-binding protein n=1 Tax=uncultured Desulfobacteraceae bacterium TaxID=218296 RepID=A0A484HIW7_9BACT|nr:DNA-binding protein [uncultured Desulfobacteraceae bacterium]